VHLCDLAQQVLSAPPPQLPCRLQNMGGALGKRHADAGRKGLQRFQENRARQHRCGGHGDVLLRARRLEQLEGITEGNPRLRVGSHVAISGVEARFENTYYVTRASHRFDLREGYRTEFSAECAYLRNS